jgi:hypothetical protein
MKPFPLPSPQQSPKFTHFINLPQALLSKKDTHPHYKKGTRGCTKYSDLLPFFLSRAGCSRLLPLRIGSTKVLVKRCINRKTEPCRSNILVFYSVLLNVSAIYISRRQLGVGSRIFAARSKARYVLGYLRVS